MRACDSNRQATFFLISINSLPLHVGAAHLHFLNWTSRPPQPASRLPNVLYGRARMFAQLEQAVQSAPRGLFNKRHRSPSHLRGVFLEEEMIRPDFHSIQSEATSRVDLFRSLPWRYARRRTDADTTVLPPTSDLPSPTVPSTHYSRPASATPVSSAPNRNV